MIDIQAADGHLFNAYLTGPADSQRALLVIHDVVGVNRYIRTMSDRLAAMGYLVIAPNLFDRVQPGFAGAYTPASMAQGRLMAAQITAAQALLDVAAAAAHTGAHMGTANLGIIGLGWGGDVAWLACTRTDLFRAGCAWGPPGIADARQDAPHCPFQLHFAEWDTDVPATHVEAIRRAQPQVELEVYAGTAQGFIVDERETFHPYAAETSRDNMHAFLRRNL